MADLHSKCQTCFYFLDAEVMGSCRRYPQTVNRHMNDWCGEHKLKFQQVEVKPEPMEYDIHTDTMRPKRKYTRKEKA